MRKNITIGILTVLVLTLFCWSGRALHAEEGPNFQILQPQQDQVINGNKLPLAIAFQSAEDAPVVRFDAYLDSTWISGGYVRNPIAVGSFRVPGDVDLTGADLRPGMHMLFVKLFDSRGRVSQNAQQITLQPTMPQPELNPPAVRITGIKDGVIISNKTDVRVEASDDSGIKWVSFYLNGEFRAMTNEPPFVWSLDPLRYNIATGNYSLTARAFDLFDNATESQPIAVQIMNAALPDGRTTFEQDPATEVEVDMPGVFPVTMLPMPSASTDFARLPFSEFTPVFASWSAGALLPALPAVAPRLDSAGLADGNLFVLVPVKSLPGEMSAQDDVEMGVRGLAMAPVLARAPSLPGPSAFSADRPLAAHAPLLLPDASDLADRNEVTDRPAIDTTPATMEKRTPAAPEDTRPSALEIAPTAEPEPAATNTVQPAAPLQIALAQPIGPTMNTSAITAPAAVSTPLIARPVAAASEPMIDIQGLCPVREGDTLEKIARAHATTPETLLKLNPGLSPDRPLTVDEHVVVPQASARIYLDDTPVLGGPDPYVQDGYSMVPFRQMIEAKHGVVVWLPKTQEVNAWANNTFLGITIGKRDARINGDTYVLPVPASVVDERTMVPLRYLMTALKLDLEYNPATGTYFLVSRPTP